MKWENASDQDFATLCTSNQSQGSFDVNFTVAILVDLHSVLSLVAGWVQESKVAEMISTAGGEANLDHEEETGKTKSFRAALV